MPTTELPAVRQPHLSQLCEYEEQLGPPDLLTRSKFPGSVQDTQNDHVVSVDFVEEPVFVQQQLADTGVGQLGHDTPTLGQRAKAFGFAG